MVCGERVRERESREMLSLGYLSIWHYKSAALIRTVEREIPNYRQVYEVGPLATEISLLACLLPG